MSNIHLHFEFKGTLGQELMQKVKSSFVQASDELENTWSVTAKTTIKVIIYDDKTFRDFKDGDDPRCWENCYLVHRPWSEQIDCNISIFERLPKEADAMIKHELAHAVLLSIVEREKYTLSHFMREAMAGVDSATQRLKDKVKSLQLKEIPNPLKLKSEEIDNRDLTEKEPFINQIQYLYIHSLGEYLRSKNGEEKMIEVWNEMDAKTDLQNAYNEITRRDLDLDVNEWRGEVLSSQSE